MTKFWLLLIPFVMPTARMGSLSYYVVALELMIAAFLIMSQATAKHHFSTQRKANGNFGPGIGILQLAVFVFTSSAYILLLALFRSNDDAHMASILAYIIRITLWGSLFIAIRTSYRRTVEKSGLAAAFANLTRPLIVITIAGGVFELLTKSFNVTAILEIFKARQDIGGIDTIHYNRYSGFFPYPGDFGIAIIACIATLPALFKNRLWRILTLFVLLFFLYQTQSRAAVATYVVYLALTCFLRFARYRGAGYFFYVIFILSVVIIFWSAKDYLPLPASNEYLIRNTESVSHFTERSKRINEYIGFINAPTLQKIFGLNKPHLDPFYESEWMGLLSRLGIMGAFIAIFFIFWSAKLTAYVMKEKPTPETNLLLPFAAFWISFIVIYCSISAGFSRPKLLIMSAILAVPLFDSSTFRFRHNKFTKDGSGYDN